MKKMICALLALLMILALVGCGTGMKKANDTPKETAQSIDVDLTRLSSTVVYSEVYAMMSAPEEYIGKTVKMCGSCSSFYSDVTGLTYYSCIVADATACCQQGIEFVLADGSPYPADGKQITVCGRFETYMEEQTRYCHLVDAVLE